MINWEVSLVLREKYFTNSLSGKTNSDRFIRKIPSLNHTFREAHLCIIIVAKKNTRNIVGAKWCHGTRRRGNNSMRLSSNSSVYYSIRFDDAVGNRAVFQSPRYADGRNEPSFRNARGSRNYSRNTTNAVYYFITSIKVTCARMWFLSFACVRRTRSDGRTDGSRRRSDAEILRQPTWRFFFMLGFNS